MSSRTLGAAIAGGASRRYGSPKPFALVGNRMLIERVLDALRDASDEQAIIANDAAAFSRFEVPVRADVITDAGALGGIHAALVHARERGCSGAVVLACDMPFPSGSLLRALARRGIDGGADAVLPESDGPRGVEPLCAYYATSCAASIEDALARGDRRVIGFLDDVRVVRYATADVARFGDPARLFMNVNTPEERMRAERIAASGT